MMNLVKVQQCIEALNLARKDLDYIQKQFKDSPELRAVYEPSARYLIKALTATLHAELSIDSIEVEDSDVWISIKGEGFESGRAPIGVLAKFLNKLNTANQHAVTILEKGFHQIGRFKSRIRDIAEFDLVTIAEGSIRLGLKTPSVDRLVDTINFQLAVERPYESLEDAFNKSRRAIEGLHLLLRGIEVAEGTKSIDRLSQEIPNRRDLLKVIYYARELAPSRNSNVERIEFWGPAIDKQVDRPIVASKDTWDRLRDLSESLRNEGEYIEIVGIIRALDLDKKTCRVKTLAIKDSDLWLDEINCELGDDLEKNDEEFLEQAKRPLMINGVLHYTDKGDVSKLVIDEICEQVSSL